MGRDRELVVGPQSAQAHAGAHARRAGIARAAKAQARLSAERVPCAGAMRCRRVLPFLLLLGACYSTPAYDGPLPPPEGFAQVFGGGERVNHLSVHLVAIDEHPVEDKLPRKGKLKEVAIDVAAGNHIVVVEWREYTSRFEWGLFSMRALSGSDQPGTARSPRVARCRRREDCPGLA